MARLRNDDARASPTLALGILVIFAFCAGSAASALSAEANTSRSTFSYDEGGSTGPSEWATLQKDWAICGRGTKQSPIDITKVEASKDLGPLKQTYKAGTATMQDRGHDFMLNFKGGNGELTIQGKEYTLQQVHWHAPSEHTVNGTGFEAEMHMLHEDPSKARAVVSVLFSTKAGRPSKLLTDLEPYFKRLAGKENAQEEVKGPIDPAAWIDKASGYYRYDGSLTTPPCTEGVIWTIMSKVANASKEQIDLLKSVSKPAKSNARPAQKINSRVVRYYEPGTK
ncbi:alpha carbonic anhydrase 7-like [Phragmites australis]|uniref:alpha carbonic anhydrase 7-like n=1 Tax=Phragmites australis TaxID=29695 RepID=UPI002D795744|nr:alpha carbonic anhydrase 7-like [Phragmites australis]